MRVRDALRYVLVGGRYAGPAAKARALFAYLVLRHDSETCHECGRRVGHAIGTYWITDDDFWGRVTGGPGGILCVRCFVRRAGPAHVRVVPGV